MTRLGRFLGQAFFTNFFNRKLRAILLKSDRTVCLSAPTLLTKVESMSESETTISEKSETRLGILIFHYFPLLDSFWLTTFPQTMDYDRPGPMIQNKLVIFCWRTLTVGGRITVLPGSCLTSLDSVVSVRSNINILSYLFSQTGD